MFLEAMIILCFSSFPKDLLCLSVMGLFSSKRKTFMDCFDSLELVHTGGTVCGSWASVAEWILFWSLRYRVALPWCLVVLERRVSVQVETRSGQRDQCGCPVLFQPS